MRLITDIVTELRDVQMKWEENPDPEAIIRCIDGYINLLNELPEDPEILFQIGAAYLQIQQPGMALQFFKRALSYWPGHPNLWSNLGVCFRTMHMIEDAKKCFNKSLQVEEKMETYNNLAACYINENNPDEGLPFSEKAISMEPDHPKPKWNAGLLLLEKQDWKNGFQMYEAGFFCKERKLRVFDPDVPWWDGKSGGVLALWDEQGLGDRLLAANMLRTLEHREDITVVLECHPRLEGIYRRSFPWIEHIFPTSKKDKVDWPKDFKIDFKCATMSLANFCWQDGEFDRTPYIKADPELVKKYRAEMESKGPGPYIAMSWAGGAPKTNTKYRTLKLNWLKGLIEQGGTWFSMQYHDWAKEKVERFREETGLPLFHLDAAQETDYDHTLAALEAADLTISGCNTVIHTCGAAGYDCWVMVPTRRAWRYPSGSAFPWYGDHMHQFHQVEDGDWESVIKEVTVHFQAKLHEWENSNVTQLSPKHCKSL